MSLVRYLVHLWVKRVGEDFNSSKLLNSGGQLVKYHPLNGPVIAQVVTERQNNPT